MYVVRTLVNAAPVNRDSGLKLVDLVGLLDYLILNESEAELLTGKKLNSRKSALEVTKEILDNVQCIAVVTTLGSQGAIVATNSDPPILDHALAPDVGPALDTTVSSLSLPLFLNSILFSTVIPPIDPHIFLSIPPPSTISRNLISHTGSR